MKQIEVVFCGDSVYLSGLAASLRLDPRLRVTQLDRPPARVIGDLRVFAPDAIVAEDPGAGAAALTLDNPQLAVIIVDAATNTLALCTGRRQTAAPVAELARVILAGARDMDDERTD